MTMITEGEATFEQKMEAILKATMVALNTMALQMELRIHAAGESKKESQEIESLKAKVQHLEEHLERTRKENNKLKMQEEERERKTRRIK